MVTNIYIVLHGLLWGKHYFEFIYIWGSAVGIVPGYRLERLRRYLAGVISLF
jgi:hypothetical protein